MKKLGKTSQSSLSFSLYFSIFDLTIFGFSLSHLVKIIENEIYDQKYLITETVDFIKLNHKQYNFHIVSGAEHNELNKICKYFLMKNF